MAHELVITDQRKPWVSCVTHNHVLTVWFTLKCSTVNNYHASSFNCIGLGGFAALLLPEGSCPSADNVAALLLLAKEACVGARRRLSTLLSRGLSWERRAKWWEQIKKDPTWNHIMKKRQAVQSKGRLWALLQIITAVEEKYWGHGEGNPNWKHSRVKHCNLMWHFLSLACLVLTCKDWHVYNRGECWSQSKHKKFLTCSSELYSLDCRQGCSGIMNRRLASQSAWLWSGIICTQIHTDSTHHPPVQERF